MSPRSAEAYRFTCVECGWESIASLDLAAVVRWFVYHRRGTGHQRSYIEAAPSLRALLSQESA